LSRYNSNLLQPQEGVARPRRNEIDNAAFGAERWSGSLSSCAKKRRRRSAAFEIP